MHEIGDVSDYTEPLWHYFKTERLIQFLCTGELYFSSAHQFQDKFEGAVSVLPPDYKVDSNYVNSDHFERPFEELRRLTKISCWHRASYESDAMWQLYSDKWRGVAIQTNLEKIKASVHPFRLEPEYGVEEIWMGNVTYVDLTKEKIQVSMMERFWYKHLAFEWEKEFRLAISLRMAEEFGVVVPEDGIKVRFEILDLIECIHLGPSLSDEEINTLREVAFEYGLGDRIKISSLRGVPRYT